MLLVFACGILLSAALNHGSTRQNEGSAGPASLEPPTMSIESGRGRLVVRGMSTSTAHESALLQLVADHFDGFDVQTSFSAGVVLTNNWDSASGRLLYALAAMDSAQAVMRDDSISIRGVTSDAGTFTTRLEFLRESLPAETLIDADVVTNEAANSASELCDLVFSRVTTGPVSFEQSSTEIRVASLATLDRISEFAHNCQRATISITGHTDASGDESWNRQLSLARAQAVADHLTDRGVGAARLIVSGSGSTEPIADNTTAIGRERNRRIEFALR
jgi:OOP family OmpA-OmpF porin